MKGVRGSLNYVKFYKIFNYLDFVEDFILMFFKQPRLL